MFTTAVSRIWLVGLVLFALTPILIAARPQPTENQPEVQVEAAKPLKETAKVADDRDPASEKLEAPLATGN